MIIHTVKQGDSLYALAKQYGTTPTKILEDNGLSNPDMLTVGQTLVILIPTKTYTVQRGDTLEKIAKREGIGLRTIWQNNPTLNGMTDIYTGQLLTISYPPAEYGTLSVNAYAYPHTDLHILRRALPYVTYLTVLAARITEDGALLLPEDDAILSETRRHGVAPLLSIENADEQGLLSPLLARAVLIDPVARANLINELEALIRERGYAGIEFSFAYVPNDLQESYANLVEDVRRRFCASGHCVFVSTLTRDEAETAPSRQKYDRALGEAANGLRLMTYALHSAYDEPAPISPLPALKQAAESALKYTDAANLSLGIPTFGYDFSLPYRAGVSHTDTLSSHAAAALAEEKQAAIMYDTQAQAPYFTYYDTSIPSPVEHLVYFEDGKSVKAKLDIIHKLGLGGVDIWNLTDDFPQLWLILHRLFDTVDAFPCHCR